MRIDAQKSTIELQVNHQTAPAYLALPDRGGPGLLVLHAWWGMKPFIRTFCDRLAMNGFTALAPDLFQGWTADTIEAAEAMVEKHNAEFIQGTVTSALNYLAGVSSKPAMGVLGFSFGAAWALVAADNFPGQVSAVVLFYGTYPTDFHRMKAKVLGHFAQVDEYETPDTIREMEAFLEAAGVEKTFYHYPGTHHWFMEEDRPQYDPEAAELAWGRTVDFLKASI